MISTSRQMNAEECSSRPGMQHPGKFLFNMAFIIFPFINYLFVIEICSRQWVFEVMRELFKFIDLKILFVQYSGLHQGIIGNTWPSNLSNIFSNNLIISFAYFVFGGFSRHPQFFIEVCHSQITLQIIVIIYVFTQFTNSVFVN